MQNQKYRLWLSFTVFYPYALFLTLFVALFLRHTPASPKGIVNAAAVLIVTSLLLAASYKLIAMLLKERELNQQERSRAARLAEISDVVNGAVLPMREKMKSVARILAEEGGLSGWRCRIVVHEDAAFLPPSGGTLGFHLPLKAGESVVGTLIVTTGRGRLDEIDLKFFEALTRMLGLFAHREKMWENFRADLERMEATLLLRTDTAPDDHRTVEHMLGMLGLAQAKTEIQKPRY